MTNELAATAGVQGLLCPVCKVNLVMTSREGVEIDYCPTCRGVWLDRGELDKIIERNIAAGGAQTGAAPMDQQPDPRNAPPSGYYEDRYYDGGHGGQGGGHGGGHGRSRGHGQQQGHGSFLRRLFD